VSTSGTARQLEKETDALPVGGGAMFMESGFAIMAFLTATVAFGGWQGYLDAGGAGKALAIFAGGLANFLSRIGVPQEFGVAYGSVFLTIMAITIMQLVVRFMRVASAEMLGERIPAMRNIHVGSIIALLLTILFVLIIPWLTIWSAFGAANQLMAGLALLLVALWLMSEGKKHAWALYPAIFMIVTDIGALLFVAYVNLFRVLPAAETTQSTIAAAVIGAICLVLIAAALVLIVDAWRAIQRARQAKPVQA
jgi:carbon starvation protein